MLIAMFAMILFGAILVVPLWLRSVSESPPIRHPSMAGNAASPLRQRWHATTVREKRRLHARAKSIGKSSHHAGL